MKRAILLACCAAFATGTAMAAQEPEYRLIEADGAFELRDYASYLVAETRVEADFDAAANVAFGRLFRYISGANRSARKLPMTAPVTQESANGERLAMTVPVNQEADGQGYRVGFIVPAGYTMASVPQPTDPTVSIREVPARRIASWRYSGRWTEARYRGEEAKLRAAIAERSLQTRGAAINARYNAPFVPWPLRRNEVLIPVAGP